MPPHIAVLHFLVLQENMHWKPTKTNSAKSRITFGKPAAAAANQIISKETHKRHQFIFFDLYFWWAFGSCSGKPFFGWYRLMSSLGGRREINWLDDWNLVKHCPLKKSHARKLFSTALPPLKKHLKSMGVFYRLHLLAWHRSDLPHIFIQTLNWSCHSS